ncbi:3705_t:CDS:1, partial [Diversispora eburnea]
PSNLSGDDQNLELSDNNSSEQSNLSCDIKAVDNDQNSCDITNSSDQNLKISARPPVKIVIGRKVQKKLSK